MAHSSRTPKPGYANVTSHVTLDLLNFWFRNPDRSADKKFFFAQQEAVESVIWLNELAHKSNRVYGFRSRPVTADKGGKVAVRVISQFGEESTKVLTL